MLSPSKRRPSKAGGSFSILSTSAGLNSITGAGNCRREVGGAKGGGQVEGKREGQERMERMEGKEGGQREVDEL